MRRSPVRDFTRGDIAQRSVARVGLGFSNVTGQLLVGDDGDELPTATPSSRGELLNGSPPADCQGPPAVRSSQSCECRRLHESAPRTTTPARRGLNARPGKSETVQSTTAHPPSERQDLHQEARPRRHPAPPPRRVRRRASQPSPRPGQALRPFRRFDESATKQQ